MQDSRKPFIVFEGLDGCGKSTQARLVYEWLKEQEVKSLFIREPGGTNVSESIRTVLKTYDMQAITELLLFNAARNEVMYKIESRIKDLWVICDRFKYSTWAYQHYGRGLPAKTLQSLEHLINLSIEPNLVFLFTHKKRTSKQDNLEKIPEDKIKYGFEQQMQNNWVVVPDLNIDDTFAFIKSTMIEKFDILKP